MSTINNISSQVSNKLNFQLVDCPSIENALINEDYIQGVTPRWIFTANTSYNSYTAASINY